MRKATSLFVGCILSASVVAATNSWANDMETYEVTITNIMQRNYLAPIMVATHEAGMSFFKVGEAPDDELAWLSEAGVNQPMVTKLQNTPGVSDVQVSTPGRMEAGKSKTVIVTAASGIKSFSIGSMIGLSNDAFAGLRDMPLPKGKQVLTYTANGYDAGAESNDETMATVPGCGLGKPAAYSGLSTGEGYVFISNGIRGKGCLDANTLDWNNPVASITIKRVD